MAIYTVSVHTQCGRCLGTMSPGEQAQRETPDAESVHYPLSCGWQGWLTDAEREELDARFRFQRDFAAWVAAHDHDDEARSYGLATGGER